MLVLVVGASGNIGQWLIDSLASRGHRIRILARNPSRINSARLKHVESTVQSTSYYDIEALDRACAGVDAIINAYSGIPELQLEGQLLLIRAAERAGVKRFVAAAWNYDWSEMPLGMHESYDAYIALCNHADMTSSIKPIYILSGVLAETFFAVPGHGDFSPKNNGCWDPEAKRLEIWGTGDEPWHWTTEKDAAEFAVHIVERNDAADGGFWRVCSGVNTLREIAVTYEKVKKCKVDVEVMGTVSDLRKNALEARRQGSRKNFWSYIGWFYQLYTIDGTWTLKTLDNNKLDVKTTSLEDFLRDNTSV
ncbi:hypothetical protein BGW36DRAFT_413932 [Talaromyces proteolyticus]|uniref:NmrA-like domain-containing protein n=1 Tax=Talaromyces proteolyticus TaxID=1131652 RepID=A0AAD4L0N0_9EURO|nr:uncharacterized protein BGW36DRAFT_413932 [Talaromyces proteolyticus]KAH8703335.1 hypothetical protein BGW36DRAFT_413932 [Talaromyces proteolyticus]